jgi:hypothetical protein
MNKYERAKELRKKCEEDSQQLLESLLQMKKDFAEFYELMRWENIGCSSEEYEKLYDNFIYPYEEGNIGQALEDLTTFCDENKRKTL